LPRGADAVRCVRVRARIARLVARELLQQLLQPFFRNRGDELRNARIDRWRSSRLRMRDLVLTEQHDTGDRKRQHSTHAKPPLTRSRFAVAVHGCGSRLTVAREPMRAANTANGPSGTPNNRPTRSSARG